MPIKIKKGQFKTPVTRFPKGPGGLGPNAKRPTGSGSGQGGGFTPFGIGVSHKPTPESGTKPPTGRIPGVPMPKIPSYRPKAYKKGSWPQGLD